MIAETMIVRPMRHGEEAAVVAMVRALARDSGLDVKPQLTAAMLRSNAELITVTVAEVGGRLRGACLTLMTFSTWRGARGLYVVDLFVDGSMRGKGIGEALIVEAARCGRKLGAHFIKLEVDHTNDGAARFYERLGFERKPNDRLFVLEADAMKQLSGGSER